MIRRLALLALLVLAPAVLAQNPMGFGRPPGLGPELDRAVIAKMKSLQAFVTGDLGVTITGEPRTRDGIMERNFIGWWSLQSFYKQKFRSWYRSFFSLPGAMALGIDITGIEYSMSHMQGDYNESELGSYHAFQSESSARKKLAQDARELYGMAQGYIDKLEARLKFEAEHPVTRSAPTSGSGEFSDLRPNETPTTILNVYPDGRQLVEELIRNRMKRKGER